MHLTLAQANKLAARLFRAGQEPAIERSPGGNRMYEYRVTTFSSRAHEQRIEQLYRPEPAAAGTERR